VDITTYEMVGKSFAINKDNIKMTEWLKNMDLNYLPFVFVNQCTN